MKLKNVLIVAFLTLTLVPVAIVSVLLYRSGFNLSKESYVRNLAESINVQVDYISQTMENNMISDYRFAHRSYNKTFDADVTPPSQRSELLMAFQSYLDVSEDKVTVCILLDGNNLPIYTVGEKATIDTILAQVPVLSEQSNQTMMEFRLDNEAYSLGIITPIRNTMGAYEGSLVSVYNKSYIFKIISSYYKISDTSIYICRQNGDVISFRGSWGIGQNDAVGQALSEVAFATEGIMALNVGGTPLSGYYKNINNTPWYLVGFVDEQIIYDFANRFIPFYMTIILGVLIVGAVLSVYFSRKVVKPINDLIKVMDGYQNSLNSNELQFHEENGYFETHYLRTKFLELMKKILLVQHNFEGVYQLYQSNNMGDINIDIDTKNQTISSNKEAFKKIIDAVEVTEGSCIVDRFTKCFCEKDQILLTEMFENMRDEHLSVACEAELYMSHPEQKWLHTLVVPMYENDCLSRLFVQLRDISSFKKQEQESTEKANRDSLTGLYNRSGFAECVSKTLQKASETDLHALLFIDMDYFKLVNDNMGHSEGDELLRSVGKIVRETVGPNDIVSRFGGDEFLVFSSATSQAAINCIKETLNERLVYHFHTDKVSFVVSASIGISTWNSTSVDTLDAQLRQADAAMYHAKREFKDRVNSL